jgi:uncharacterized protein (TIGR02996 family)
MSDETANQFMQAILAEPDGDVPRLVFADWLEETGNDSNAAWAQFIRLQAELGRDPGDIARRRELTRAIRGAAAGIRARLTLRAVFFARYHERILQLIPADNLRLNLTGFAPPQSVVRFLTAAAAWRTDAVPVVMDDEMLILAAEHLINSAIRERFEAFVGRDVQVVLALPGQARRVIERWLGEFTT